MDGWTVGQTGRQRDRPRNMLLHNEIVGTTLVMITSDIIIGKTGQEESYKKKRNQPEYVAMWRLWLLCPEESEIWYYWKKISDTSNKDEESLQNTLDIYVSAWAGWDHKETTLKSRSQDSQHSRVILEKHKLIPTCWWAVGEGLENGWETDHTARVSNESWDIRDQDDTSVGSWS